jgi:hypothetical protein
MQSWLKKMALCKAVLVAALTLAGAAAHAQQPCSPPPTYQNCPPVPCSPLPPGPPGVGQPGQPGLPGQPDMGAGTTGMAALPERGGGAGIGSSAELDPGYIDSAVPRTQFRIRYDSFYDNNRPDRADFFYSKCGCLGTSDAHGPPLTERSVDAHELKFYGEYALTERFSGFAEIPIRWIDPEVNQHASGLSDVNFGFKYAVIYEDDRLVTFQLRATAPSGDPFKGLGTDNWFLEPALLGERKLTDKLALLAELRDAIPVARVDDFAGNVLRYGVGVSYLAYCGDCVRVTPIVETVGWTVLSGKEFSPDIPNGGIKSASGDTIVNLKFGLRFNFGQTTCGSTFINHSDLYVGYGRALTGDVWYKEVVRLEYRLRF